MKRLGLFVMLVAMAIGLVDCTRISRISLQLDAEAPDLQELEKEKAELEKQVNELRNDAKEHDFQQVLGEFGGEFNYDGYNIMSYTLASFGGAMGLILIFGGVKIPRTSTAIMFGFGFGLMAFSVVWWGISFSLTDPWYTRFMASYLAALTLGIILILAGMSVPVSSLYTTAVLGGIAYMVLGIMVNTAGVYTLGGDMGSYFTFGIAAATGFVFGCVLHASLQTGCLTKRTLANASYSFVGSYLLVKCCGVAASQYPNEWGNLKKDPHAQTWQYFTMFGCTFLCAALSFTFQYFVYRTDPEDQFAATYDIQSGKYQQSAKSQSAMARPTHASNRRMTSGKYDFYAASSPEFGGMHNPPSASRVQYGNSERYVSQYGNSL